MWFEANYVLGKDSQYVKCIPGVDWFLGDRGDREIERDGIYMVASKGLDPIYPDGTVLVKYLRGLPGDTVKIDETGVYVNGRNLGTGQLPLAHKFEIEPESLHGERVLGDDEYWLMGTAALSFDSRYWGPVSESQVIRRAYAIF
ncbi:S26 family signal peptidase (plasmid) [Hydrocarboniclastica marina]|uniref:S26 family signal peptidase n=1 Tax=Hydrocarboniclastica marina TaxID=2259620 RepID=A0A4P7XN41_9ALTE|nr:S26 family signal peptidase [Hydrocarboniclastica marina]